MVDEEQTEDSGTTTPSSPVSAETLSAGLTPANQVGSLGRHNHIVFAQLTIRKELD